MYPWGNHRCQMNKLPNSLGKQHLTFWEKEAESVFSEKGMWAEGKELAFTGWPLMVVLICRSHLMDGASKIDTCLVHQRFYTVSAICIYLLGSFAFVGFYDMIQDSSKSVSLHNKCFIGLQSLWQTHVRQSWILKL